MDPVSFDAVTRRASLTTLGAAGLVAAFAAPFGAEARKNKKKKKSDVNKFCKRQAGECLAVIIGLCDGDSGCLDALPCCTQLRTCNMSGFLSCVIAAAD